MLEKKDLKFLIKRIKAATGLNQDGIAKDINYSRSHFSTLKTANSEELYDLLEKHFEEDLQARVHFEDARLSYMCLKVVQQIHGNRIERNFWLPVCKLLNHSFQVPDPVIAYFALKMQIQCLVRSNTS